MGKIYDITEKLTNDNPIIKIGEKTYRVNNSKNTFLQIQKYTETNKEDAIDIIIKLALGEEAFNEIEEMQLSMNSYKNIITAIMAAVMEMEFDEAEKHFRNTTKSV